jgi:hypothetical protein
MSKIKPGDMFIHKLYGYVCTVTKITMDKPRGSQKTPRILYRSGNYTHGMRLLDLLSYHRELEIEEKAELL